MGVLITFIVLDVLILLGVIVGAISLAKFGRVADAAEDLLKDIRSELPQTVRVAHDAIKQIETLAVKSEVELQRVDDVLKSINRLISGAAIADVAVDAVKNSKNTLVSIVAGLKEGLRVLRHPETEKREE